MSLLAAIVCLVISSVIGSLISGTVSSATSGAGGVDGLLLSQTELVVGSALRIILFFVLYPSVEASLSRREFALVRPQTVIDWLRWRTPAFDRARWTKPSVVEMVTKGLVSATALALVQFVLVYINLATTVSRIGPLDFGSPVRLTTDILKNLSLASVFLSANYNFAFDAIVSTSTVTAILIVISGLAYWVGLRTAHAYKLAAIVFVASYATMIFLYVGSETISYRINLPARTKAQTERLVLYSLPVESSSVLRIVSDFIVGPTTPKIGGACLSYAIAKDPRFGAARRVPQISSDNQYVYLVDATTITPREFPNAIYATDTKCKEAVANWTYLLDVSYRELWAKRNSHLSAYSRHFMGLQFTWLPLMLFFSALSYLLGRRTSAIMNMGYMLSRTHPNEQESLIALVEESHRRKALEEQPKGGPPPLVS